jgi:hypothetical protein
VETEKGLYWVIAPTGKYQLKGTIEYSIIGGDTSSSLAAYQNIQNI